MAALMNVTKSSHSSFEQSNKDVMAATQQSNFGGVNFARQVTLVEEPTSPVSPKSPKSPKSPITLHKQPSYSSTLEKGSSTANNFMPIGFKPTRPTML